MLQSNASPARYCFVHGGDCAGVQGKKPKAYITGDDSKWMNACCGSRLPWTQKVEVCRPVKAQFNREQHYAHAVTAMTRKANTDSTFHPGSLVSAFLLCCLQLPRT